MKWVEGIPIMFFLHISDVTQRQWKRVMGKTLKRAKGDGD